MRHRPRPKSRWYKQNVKVLKSGKMLLLFEAKNFNDAMSFYYDEDTIRKEFLKEDYFLKAISSNKEEMKR